MGYNLLKNKGLRLETELNKKSSHELNVIGNCRSCKVGQIVETVRDGVLSRRCVQCGIDNSHGDVVFTMAEAQMWK